MNDTNAGLVGMQNYEQGKGYNHAALVHLIYKMYDY